MQALRTCTRCEVTRHLGFFYATHNGQGDIGFTARCRSCVAKDQYEWRVRTGRKPSKGNRATRLNRKYRKKYGISWFDKNSILASQGGRCANAGCPNQGTDLDHCHATGKVRGVLCKGCNTALGFAKDSTQVLAGLIGYLEPKPAGLGEALLWL